MRIEVLYLDIPPGAQETMTASAQNCNAISAPETLATGGQDEPWATLEPFGWPLDGSRIIAPDTARAGFWSAEAVTDSYVPEIILSLPESCSTTGITFTFSPATGEFCSRMQVGWYAGQTLLREEEVCPDKPQWVLARTVENFDRVQIRLLETNLPGQFAKLQKITLGQIHTFSQQELRRVSLVNEADPSLSELTVDTMTVEVWDTQDRELLPQKDQYMELYRDGTLLASQAILKSSRRGRQHHTFTCQSLIGALEDTFLGGLYTNAPVSQVLDEILEGIDYEMDVFVAAGTVTGYLPVCTRREALQQVAFAVGAVVSTRGTRGIRLTGVPRQITGSFRSDAVFQGGRMDTTPQVYKIEVAAHGYAPSDQRETLIDGEVFSGEEILLTFQSAHYDYEITGGTLCNSGPNFAVITADGAVTLTGRSYHHSTVRCSRTTGTGKTCDQIRSVENATLIHSGNVKAVLERLYGVYSHQQSLSHTVVIDGQYAGQLVAVEDPWGGRVQGYIASMQSDLTPNSHTAKITIVGTRSELETAQYYAGMLYAGDKEGIG